MQASPDRPHSSYFGLRPNECVAHYLNRDLITRVACLGAVFASIAVVVLAVLQGYLDERVYLLELLILFAIIVVEYVLMFRFQYDFQGIITLDADPEKMLEVEQLLDSRLWGKSRKMQHRLIGAQAAMLWGDVAQATELLNSIPTTKRTAPATKVIRTNIALGCAVVEEDWNRVRVLRNELSAQNKGLRGGNLRAVELMTLFADESLAVAEGDCQRAGELLDRCEASANLPQQRANIAYRRGEIKRLEGCVTAAYPYYRKAVELGGTCLFAQKAASWLEAGPVEGDTNA